MKKKRGGRSAERGGWSAERGGRSAERGANDAPHAATHDAANPPLRAPRSDLRACANTRQLAFAVLDESATASVFVTDLLKRQLAACSLSKEETGLTTELVYGIVRRRETLNALVQRNVKRPRQQIEPQLWTLLQLGAYQLVFLEGIPSHAAVNETVGLAKWLGQQRWTGFVNGVLRSIDRGLTEEFTDTPAGNAVPASNGRYRILNHDAFANPGDDPAGYLTQAFSLPHWLIDRWQPRFSFEELQRLGFWFNTAPNICLRVNTLKTNRDALLESFREADVPARSGEYPQSVWLEKSGRIETLPGFAEGGFSVQDETAMQAAGLLAPQPGQTVLDLCAAPGTKTAHLAELMQNRGTIIATDVQPDRLQLIGDGVKRLGIGIVQTKLIEANGGRHSRFVPAAADSDREQLSWYQFPLASQTAHGGPFDAVLVDVPCSNTGVLARRPDARWRIQPKDLVELCTLQQRLLAAGCERLKPGGRIVYSTCSIEPEENTGVVQAVLNRVSDMRLLETRESLPGQPSDGGFLALLERAG